MDAFTLTEILAALAIVAVAGLVHGTFGVGFPMVATPMLALVTDVKTAILLLLAPNLAVNLWSLLHGGGWRESVRRHWPVALWMLLGSVLGTLLLTAVDPNPFRLLLAFIILLYLFSQRLERLDWGVLRRHPRAGGAGAGLLAGLLGGTVNVGGPPLLIYFLELGVTPLMLVQTVNFCFLLGKGAQALTFAAVGQWTAGLALLSLPLIALALTTLRTGMWLRGRVPADTYRSWLRGLLGVLCVLLVVQFLRGL